MQALPLAVVLLAALTIAAKYRRPVPIGLFTVVKPLTTLLILAIAVLPGTLLDNKFAAAICLGLVFSLIGDFLLVQPSRFLLALLSFLFALLCYVFTWREGLSAGGFGWLLLACTLIGASVLRTLWPGLRGPWRVPVSLYVVTMALMVSLAAGRFVLHPASGTLCALIGAALFMASDSMLAIDRFCRPYRLADAAVLSTYYLAQLLIALSVGLPGFPAA